MSALAMPISDYLYSSSSSIGVSPASSIVHDEFLAVSAHFTLPVTRATIEQRVAALAETWREERGFTSSMTEIILAPAYQQIIGLGSEALPAIIRELARRPDHWFWALQVITGVNPVQPEDAGDVRAMTAAWLGWAKSESVVA